MTPFDADTDWRPGPDGSFEGVLDEGWAQGRTIFGGLVTCGAFRFLRHLVEVDRGPLEVHTRYVGPLAPGPFRVRGEVLRSGGSVTQVEARVEGSDGLATVVLAAFARPRESSVRLTGPERGPRPDPAGFVDLPHVPGVTPAFLDRVSLRWVEGQPPFTGATEARVGGWCAVQGTGLDAAPVALTLLDAWPPPGLTMLTRPAAASTLAWTGYLHDLPADGAGWWYYAEEGVAGSDGAVVSTGRLYAPDGRLAATRSQLAAIYG